MELVCANVNAMFFNELLFHDDAVREHLRIRRAIYDNNVEMYFFVDSIDAIEEEISRAILRNK